MNKETRPNSAEKHWEITSLIRISLLNSTNEMTLMSKI